MNKFRPFLKYAALGALLLVVWMTWGVKAPSQVQNVAGVSVDPAGGGRYLFGLELANTDKEDSFTVKSEVLQVQASSLAEALELASLQNEYAVTLTHGSLVILHPDLRMPALVEMLLTDWKGQSRAFLTVADGCKASEILRADAGENLRSGQLSEQVLRARRAGRIKVFALQEFCSRYLEGETLALPLVATQGKSYRISGSLQLRRAV